MFSLKQTWYYLRGNYKKLIELANQKIAKFEQHKRDDPDNADYYQSVIDSINRDIEELNKTINND